MKMTSAKKLLLTLGLGLGMSISAGANASYCSNLLDICEGSSGNWYQACVQYQRDCGMIP